MENIPVCMIRKNFHHLAPVYPLPDGFTIVHYARHAAAWARVETLAGEFDNEVDALRHFREEFVPQARDLAERMLFIQAPDGQICATATAWYGTWYGVPMGRLHWVAVIPAYQGLGLSKALVSRLLYLLANYHDMAYLTSQTISWKAIKVYLDYGFAPFEYTPFCARAWHILWEKLHHPALKEYEKNPLGL